MRRGRINIIGIVLAIAAAVGGVWLYRFGPYYWDHRVMDEVVRASARGWKDYGVGKARRQLNQELYNRDVPTYISEDLCSFREEPGKKVVLCEWTVQESWPLIDRVETMHFVSKATLYPSGRVE